MEGYATRLVDTLRPLLIPEAVNYVDPLHTVLVQLLEDIVSRSVEESCPSMSANSNLGSGTEKSSRGASSSQPMRMSFDEDIRHHLRTSNVNLSESCKKLERQLIHSHSEKSKQQDMYRDIVQRLAQENRSLRRQLLLEKEHLEKERKAGLVQQRVVAELQQDLNASNTEINYLKKALSKVPSRIHAAVEKERDIWQKTSRYNAGQVQSVRVEKDVLLHQLDKERSRYGRRYLLSSSLAEGNSSETVADPLPLSAGAGEGSSRLRESLDSLCPQSFSSSVDISAAAGEITSGLWDKTLPEGTTPASSTCKEHSLNSLNEELLQSQLEAQDMCKAVEKISSRVESLTAENQKLQSALETVRNEAESTKDLLAQKDDMLSDQMESLRELRSSNQELWAQCREFMRLTERNGALLETEMQPKGFESSPKEDVGLREKIRLLHSITHELKIGLTELLSSAEERNGARWSRSAPSHVYALSGNAEPDTLGGHESSSPLHEMDAISAELARLVDLSAVIQSKLCEGRESHQEDLRAFQTQHESQCDVLECLCRQLEKEKVILEKTLEELRGILGAQKVFCDAVETGTLQAIDSLKHELLSKEEELASAKLDLERKQSTISSMLNQLADHQALKDRESSLNTMLEEERNEIQAERRQRELFAAMERELFQKQLSDLQQPKDDESDILFWSDEDFKDFDSALNGVDALMRKLMDLSQLKVEKPRFVRIPLKILTQLFAHTSTDPSLQSDSSRVDLKKEEVMDGLHNDDQSTPGADNDESYCLPERLEHAEARAEALTRQLDAIPPTLLIAQAEKRVLESRMEHLRQQLITLSQDHKEEAELVRAENEAMLQLSERERKALQVQLHEQALTIHQLSLHIQLLQAQELQANKSYTLRLK